MFSVAATTVSAKYGWVHAVNHIFLVYYNQEYHTERTPVNGSCYEDEGRKGTQESF